jgi:hypothetical protein
MSKGWVKSSYSANGNCVEWRKSSYSGTCECVEVRHDHTMASVRDSKDPNGGMLTFPADTWSAFISGVKDGRFDL